MALSLQSVNLNEKSDIRFAQNTQRGKEGTMKKYLFAFFMMAFFAGMFIVATPTETSAQSYYTKRVVRNGRVRYVRVRKPSYYRRHRNRINMAAGTAGGAILGGLIGGRKGALIGAGAGLGGSALYTYKLNPKTRKYYKVRRNRRR
jgi:outer membrane lipoprotein SlyB